MLIFKINMLGCSKLPAQILSIFSSAPSGLSPFFSLPWGGAPGYSLAPFQGNLARKSLKGLNTSAHGNAVGYKIRFSSSPEGRNKN